MAVQVTQRGPNTYLLRYDIGAGADLRSTLFDLVGQNGWTEIERTDDYCEFTAASHVPEFPVKRIRIHFDGYYIRLHVMNGDGTVEAANSADNDYAQRHYSDRDGSLLVVVAQDRLVLLSEQFRDSYICGSALANGFSACMEIVSTCPGEPAFPAWAYINGGVLAGHRHADGFTGDLSLVSSPIPGVTDPDRHQCLAGPMFPGLIGSSRSLEVHSYTPIPPFYQAHDRRLNDYITEPHVSKDMIWPVYNFDAEPNHQYLRGYVRDLFIISRSKHRPGHIVSINMGPNGPDPTGTPTQFVALPAFQKTMFLVRA